MPLVAAVLLSAVPPATWAEGLFWEGGVTAVYQAADAAGVDAELGASADLFIRHTRPRGEWLLYVEAASTVDADGVAARYPGANADAGTVLDAGGDGRAQVSELNYTRHWTPRDSLMLGLIDPSSWLDREHIANDENLHFLNRSFVNNPTIPFPDYTLGAVYRRAAQAAYPELVVVLARADGLADLPDRAYRELADGDRRGVFLGAGTVWGSERGRLRLGGWLRTAEGSDFAGRARTRSRRGACLVLGREHAAHAFNVRLGLARGGVTPASGFAALAWERETQRGVLGAGIARTWHSGRRDGRALDDVTDAELFFRTPLRGDALQLTPSLQYAGSPHHEEAGTDGGTHALVLGLRLRWNF